MNCKQVRRRLLKLERPELPQEVERAHLLECSGCRAWLGHLVRLEQSVPALPIPASRGKTALVRTLLPQAEPAPTPVAAWRLRLHKVVTTADIVRRAAWPVGPWRGRSAAALAAAMLFLALGRWAALTPIEPPRAKPVAAPTADPLLATLLRRDLRLAAATSARERLQTLAALADDLHDESNALAVVVNADELRALTKLYQRVIETGILPVARDVPLDERQAVLEPIATRLVRAGEEADQRAEQACPASATLLRSMASAARAADESLRALLDNS